MPARGFKEMSSIFADQINFGDLPPLTYAAGTWNSVWFFIFLVNLCLWCRACYPWLRGRLAPRRRRPCCRTCTTGTSPSGSSSSGSKFPTAGLGITVPPDSTKGSTLPPDYLYNRKFSTAGLYNRKFPHCPTIQQEVPYRPILQQEVPYRPTLQEEVPYASTLQIQREGNSHCFWSGARLFLPLNPDFLNMCFCHKHFFLFLFF